VPPQASQAILPQLTVVLTYPPLGPAVKEGYHLYAKLGLNPYEGGSFHQAPLLLLLGPALEAADPIVTNLVWTAVEVATACLLAGIASGRNRGIIKGEGEKVWKGWVVAAM
jgi:hypothetical protein